jgi:hypothetical protein
MANTATQTAPTTQTVTPEMIKALQAQIAALELKNAQLEAAQTAKNNRQISFKVGRDKGGIGIYGLTKQFPVTIYVEQLPRFVKEVFGVELNDDMPIVKFANTHDALLSRKDDTPQVQASKLALRMKDTSGVVSSGTAPKNNQQTA